MPLGGGAVGEGVGQTGALHQELVDALDRCWLGDPGEFQDRGPDVDDVGELGAKAARVGEMAGPVHHHRVACAAEVGGDLLAPLERRVPGPRPRGRAVRRRGRAAPGVDPAGGLDHGELLLGGQGNAVLHRQLVEGAGEGALHGGAVVAPDVEDQGVVELAHPLELIQHPAHVVIGVLLVAGIDLHLPGIQGPFLVRERVPGREGTLRGVSTASCGITPEGLLAGEDLFSVDVPAAVELAAVLGAPLLGHVMGGVGAAGRVVHEPRLGVVVGGHPMQPLDCLVGHGVG